MLRCLPNWFKTFKTRVLADAGFGSAEFIEGCVQLEIPVLVGVACDRKTKQGVRLDQLLMQGGVIELHKSAVPVYVAWFKLKGKNGRFEWRYIVSSQPATPRTMIKWGRRRWFIEAFFKTMKSRFGLHQFGQRTIKGVLRFFLLVLIAFVLVFWLVFPLVQGGNTELD
jgi:Transposase DDE domain